MHIGHWGGDTILHAHNNSGALLWFKDGPVTCSQAVCRS
jgi:hypothetical protein